MHSINKTISSPIFIHLKPKFLLERKGEMKKKNEKKKERENNQIIEKTVKKKTKQ
jgi:hypothetical protein